MNAKSDPPGKASSPEQQLRAENEALRAELEKTRAYLKLQKYRRREFSRMLKIGYWEWDAKTQRPISYSPEVANVLGLERDMLEKFFHNPDSFKHFLHPDDLQHYEDNLNARALLKPGVANVFEYRVIVDKREIRHIREYEQGVFTKNGKLVSSFGMVQDVTETSLTVDALRESEERYHSLFEQMPLGVQEEDYSAIKKYVDKLQSKDVTDIEAHFNDNPKILRDLVGQTHITNVNETLMRMHNADTREEFLAGEADVDDWWDAQWAEYYAAEIAALASDTKIYEAEKVDSQVDGKYFETRSIATLVRGYEDNWERVITIHDDISARKTGESALIEAMTQAEQANQAKSHFLSSMSHELRTPLNAILGFSQLFAYDRNLSEQHLVNANEINRAGKHLMSLIDQILDLSLIEAGESDVSLEPVKLNRVLNDSIKWAMPLAKERGITIDFDVDAFENIIVVADSIRLKQVFLNLITNAVKYNRDGGRVSVISEPANVDVLRVGIRDTGTGISAEKLKELFQPFNRLGAEFSGIEGSGIGLVISRQLVDLMKGELHIESEVDVGSTFWVSMQLAPALAKVLETQILQLPDSLRAAGPDENSRILVAEDNLINQELMAAQLKMLGYKADYAANGVKALEHWQSGNYGLLLTDIRMPDMNGYDLVREIRQLENVSGRRAPVIAITANALETDVEKCYAVGVDDVIPKPVELEDLRKALDKWVPQGSQVAPAAPAPTAPSPAALTPAALTPAALTPEKVVDYSVLTHSIGEKPELQCDLLKSYLDALENEFEHIQRAFAWKNSEQIVEYSHKLKSSSRSLGVIGVAQACEEIESSAKQVLWPQLEELLPSLGHHVDAARSTIRVFLDEQANKGSQTDQVDLAQSAPVFDLLQGEDEDKEEVTQFSIKLMLVDDDYIMHRITTVMLNDLGVSGVINAMSGSDALDILKAQDGDAIDVIICDLNMPEMDGVEFIRHLAQQKYQGALILTSGEDMRILKTVEKLAIEHDLQVLGILEKPVAPARIGELLESLDQVQQEGTMILFDAVTLVELKTAIGNGELDTHFQPKIDIKSGKVVGIEALARWNHPVKGMIRPDAFISLAEEHGLISELTDAVCAKSMDYAARLKAMNYELNVAINLSVDSLTDLDWPEKISSSLQHYGLEPSSIFFEITESRLMEHLSVALDILSRLSLKRFNLSIDDFGTGYSSMEQLQRIPFSEFKIDRAFVHGAAREASAQAILESSVLLAKKLNMKVVAEGVENQEDWDLVARLGCDQVQGYLVARPMPFKQLAKWLKDPEALKRFTPRA